MKRKPRLGSIYQRGEVWWLKYRKNGQIFRESSHSDSYADAERLLKRRQGEIVTGKFGGLAIERIKFSELLDDVMDDYRVNKRRSLPQLESRVRLHLRPIMGEARVAELSTAHIKRYVGQRMREEASTTTINRELEIVERALTLGQRCEPPKVLRPIHIPMFAENNVRTGFLDDAGYLAIRQELPEHLRALFVVAYHVGSRLGELRKLEWCQVDLANQQIQLRPGTTKNMKGRTLPIYGEMGKWIEMQMDIRNARFPKCRYVFFDDGRQIGDFRKAWKSACARASRPELLFHDLRRSAVRNMRLAGITENVAMEFSGHRTRSVFERYNIVGGKDLKDAAAKMEERIKTSLGTILGTVSTVATEEENRPTEAKRLN